MKRKILSLSLLAFLGAVTLSSCKKDKTELNEEELITSVTLTFTEVGGSSTPLTFSFKDPDGEGGNAPTQFDEIVLAPNKAYTCAISFLNESVSPADNITAEIAEEGHEHQIYFVPAPASLATINQLSTDANGLPLGLTSRWTTSATAGSGTVKVALKHKPDGMKQAGDGIGVGETDVELDFDFRVQ